MDEKQLNSDEICKIIEACAKAGVSSLKCGPLELSFGKQTESHHSVQPAVTEITDDQHRKMTEDAITQDEIRLRKDQIEQMLIENPALAEKLVADGDLEDDDGTDGDE